VNAPEGKRLFRPGAGGRGVTTGRPGDVPPPHDMPPDAGEPGTVPLTPGARRDLQGRRPGLMGPPEDRRNLILRATTYPAAIVPLTRAGHFEPTFEAQLRADLGSGVEVDVS